MPKIQWSGLPETLRKHLLIRLKERAISEEDLLRLMEWRQSDPDAPEGLWYKDFGSFKILQAIAQHQEPQRAFWM